MPEQKQTYVTAVGRRKTASARVKLTPAKENSVTVNGQSAREYFKTSERESITGDAFKAGEWKNNYEVQARVKGGGVAAQAVAVRHAISRAITQMEEGSRPALKAAGFLKRDPRAVERKKPGLRKARKSPQWSKR
ncbi:MAG: small subunit ribosomal protein S9 [Parcubacteria bacterium C7867-004]|nr:MAG: small subunit ribosomal protein S9 [Parcubacteria bacterium C7867-004]